MSRYCTKLLSKPTFTWLRRAVWGSMVLMHAPAFVGMCKSFMAGELGVGALAQFTGLVASMLFFALKFADVRVLRGRTDWRSCVAYGLVIAVVHLGMLDLDGGSAMWLEFSPLVSLTLVVDRSSCNRKALSSLLARFRPKMKCRFSVSRLQGTVWSDPSLIHCWVLASPTCIPRSPPS